MRGGGRRADERAVFLGRARDSSRDSEKAQSEDRAFTGPILDRRIERYDVIPPWRSSIDFYGPSGAYNAQNIVQRAGDPESADCFVGPRRAARRLDSFCDLLDRAHASPPSGRRRPECPHSPACRRCRPRTLYPYQPAPRRHSRPARCGEPRPRRARRPREGSTPSMRQQTRRAEAHAPVRSRCLHPGQQQGRRWPSSSSSRVLRMRRSRVVACFASSTQQMNSLRARGVMSLQAASAVVLASSASRRSTGSSCTTPPGTRLRVTKESRRARAIGGQALADRRVTTPTIPRSPLAAAPDSSIPSRPCSNGPGPSSAPRGSCSATTSPSRRVCPWWASLDSTKSWPAAWLAV